MSKPKIYVVCGPSGVGKTTTAKHLGMETNAPVITSEEIIKELFGTISNSNKDLDFNSQEIAYGYNAMLIVAKRILVLGQSVVLDGVFRSEEQRNKVRELAQELQTQAQFIEVTCPEEIVKNRITARLALGKQPGGYQNHLYLKKIFEPILEEHTIIDSSQDILEQLHGVLN